MLHTADKKLLTSYVGTVSGIAEEIGEAEVTYRKVPELVSLLRRWRTDLEFVNTDHLDTISRL